MRNLRFLLVALVFSLAACNGSTLSDILSNSTLPSDITTPSNDSTATLDLSSAKATAIAEIEAYVDLPDYYSADATLVEDAIDDAIAAITAATSATDIDTAVADAKTAIDAIPTMADVYEDTKKMYDFNTLITGYDSGHEFADHLVIDSGLTIMKLSKVKISSGTAIETAGAITTTQKSIKITTTTAANIRVVFQATGTGADNRFLVMLDEAGAPVSFSVKPTRIGISDTDILSVPAGGTYYLGGNNSVRIYSIEIFTVKEAVTAPTVTAGADKITWTPVEGNVTYRIFKIASKYSEAVFVTPETNEAEFGALTSIYIIAAGDNDFIGCSAIQKFTVPAQA